MKRTLKLISFILVVLTVSAAFTASPSAAITNDEIKAKQKEISGLQSLLKQQSEASQEARKKLEETKNGIEENKKLILGLIDTIETLDIEIATTEDLLKNYEELIALKEEEIKATEDELAQLEDSLVEFLRYEYENEVSPFETLEFLLESESLSDFLSNINYISTLMNYQDHLIQELENKTTQYNGQKYDLEKEKKTKEEFNESLKEKRAYNEQLKAQATEMIAQLEADQIEYEDELAISENIEEELKASIEKAQAEEAKLIEDERKREEERKRKEEEERKRREAEEAAKKAAELAKANSADKEAAESAKAAEQHAAAFGDGYMWPVPTDKRFSISGWFGYEPNPIGSGIRFHKALDIAADNGTSIYAAAAGKVITAKYSSSYGNYVVILHSDGYSTLYAHASKLLVSVGDKVKQGDVIARVGSTGYSTGNHLHFEIIQPDGRTREDPTMYFPKMTKLHLGDSSRYDYLNNPRKTTYKV